MQFRIWTLDDEYEVVMKFIKHARGMGYSFDKLDLSEYFELQKLDIKEIIRHY